MKPTPSFPRACVVRREQHHRRWVIGVLAVLLLLGTSPLLGHHLPVGFDQQLAGRDHIWAVCLTALHLLLAPVHGVFHLLFFAGLGYATYDRVSAWLTQRSVLAALEAGRPGPDDAFSRAATAVSLDLDVLRIVPGLPSPAFTAGLIRPRIYVAGELAERLPAPQLEAVLAHEAAHVRRRDPLRLSLLRFLACTLFWLPAVRWLAEDIADDTEIRADDDASRDHPLALANAILLLAQWGQPRPVAPAGVGFDDRDLLDRRIRRLAGEHVPPKCRLTRRSVLGATLALSLVWLSGAAIAHPLPDSGHQHDAHCEHEDAAPLNHLFCLGFYPPPAHGCGHGRATA